MRPILLSMSMLLAALVQAQIPEFSSLSSRAINRYNYFHSLRINDGILYFAPTANNVNMLYKVDFNGNLVDSVNMSQGDYKFTGYLAPFGEKVLFVGEANKPFLSYNQSFNDRRSVVVVLNQGLDFLSVNLYDNIPYGAGRTISVQTGDPSSFIQPVSGIGAKGDTVIITKDYTYFDTLTFTPYDFDRVLEKMVINGPALPSISISSTTAEVYTAVFTDVSIFVYGQSSDCCGGLLIDPTAVGEYDYAGNFVDKHKLMTTPQGLDPTWASVGNRIGDRIYSSCVEEGFLGEPCATAMLDSRDLEFTLKHRVKVPDCDMAPSGTKCVAKSGGAIYFLTKTNDYNLGLYKFDTLLNLLWGKIFDFEVPHLGISISDTPDGGVILESALYGQAQAPDTLRLYKINPTGDIVSSSEFAFRETHDPLVFPNPFTSEISVKGLPKEGASVRLHDQLGRLVHVENLSAGSIHCPNGLAPGRYLLSFRNAESGQLLHSQWVVKVE